MAVIIPVAVHLKEGARFRYDCPSPMTDNPTLNAKYAAYKGKLATFVSHKEQFIGPLDHDGRLPGRYIDASRVNVRFDGEETVREESLGYLTVHTGDVVLATSLEEGDRLGNLPYPILYYPGDRVMYRERPEGVETGPVQVMGVSFAENGKVLYRVREFGQTWLEHHQSLRLVSRGNVWALYHDPKWLEFDSDEEEMQFWAQDGVSRSAKNPNRGPSLHDQTKLVFGVPLAEAWGLFQSGLADLIIVPEIEAGKVRRRIERDEKDVEPRCFQPLRLHDCFTEHRNRVHKLTDRLWADKAKKAK